MDRRTIAKERRNLLGLGQAYFAERFEVTKQSISNLESGYTPFKGPLAILYERELEGRKTEINAKLDERIKELETLRYT